MHKLSILIAIPTMILAPAAFAVDTSAPTMESAGFANQEVNAAKNSADQAAATKDIAGIHEHLQSVIDCLVGPQGPGFDAAVHNPCNHMGRGAMADVLQGSDESRLLNDALGEAKDGLRTANPDSAHSIAKELLNDLEKAQNSTQQ